MNPVGAPLPGGPAAAAAAKPDARADLRRLADQLQAVFMNQLFQAMRATVPESEGLGTDPGRQVFQQLFDERVAEEASARMHRGISEALYRQLAARLDPAEPTETK